MFVGIVFMVVSTFAVAPPEDAHKITKLCYYTKFFQSTYTLIPVSHFTVSGNKIFIIPEVQNHM